MAALPLLGCSTLPTLLHLLTNSSLEHPCRTHFHAPPPVFDPHGDATGHELMASTYLYAHAPSSVFKHLDDNNTTWTAPSLSVSRLLEMSHSLPKDHFEITPVQAWFLLCGKFEAGSLLGRLDELERGVGRLVACWAFGAVMDVERFWDVVGGVMGE